MGMSISSVGDPDHLDDQNPVVIAVVGQTGVGKSTFINCVVGEEVLEVGHSRSPTARKIQHLECEISERPGASQRVIFVEVPGFDSEKEGIEIAKKLERWLKTASSKKLEISGILYLHRITDSSPPIRHLKLLRKLCETSTEGFPNPVIAVITMWALLMDKGIGKRRIVELENYLNTLPTVVSDFLHFEKTPESAAFASKFLGYLDRFPGLERMLAGGERQEYEGSGKREKGRGREEESRNLEQIFHEEAEGEAANEATKRRAQEEAHDKEKECADREKRRLFKEEQRRKEIEEEEAVEAAERVKREELRKRAREQQEREEVQIYENERRTRAEAAMVRQAQEEAQEKEKEDIERQERKRMREERRRKEIEAEDEEEARERNLRAERALTERAKEEAEEQNRRDERMRRWDAERAELQKQEDERRRKMQEDQARRENQERELMQRWEVERQERELYRECCDLVSRLARNPESWARLTKFRGNDSEAQAMVDFLNKILEKNHCHPAERKHVLNFLSRITKSTQKFPKCLELEGVDCDLSSDPVAEGGTGAIFRGQHNGRVVCVKAVQSRKAGTQCALRAQVAELTLWAHILHPNIHPFYGIFLSQELTSRICIVSPWAEAGNLSEFLKATPGLQPKDRIPFLLDITSGLQYLHSLEIVHGDLKANNILVSQMRAVLSDFGTSQMENMAPSTTTAPGVPVGTPHWMPPELLKADSKQPATCESDMWSFACLAYEVMTDKIPFEEYGKIHLVRLIYAIVFERATPSKPSNSDHAILSVWPLLQRCWDHNEGKRPTAEEARVFLAALGVEDTRPPFDDNSIQFNAHLQERRKLRSDAVAIDIHCVHDILRRTEAAHQ